MRSCYMTFKGHRSKSCSEHCAHAWTTVCEKHHPPYKQGLKVRGSTETLCKRLLLHWPGSTCCFQHCIKGGFNRFVKTTSHCQRNCGCFESKELKVQSACRKPQQAPTNSHLRVKMQVWFYGDKPVRMFSWWTTALFWQVELIPEQLHRIFKYNETGLSAAQRWLTTWSPSH